MSAACTRLCAIESGAGDTDGASLTDPGHHSQQRQRGYKRGIDACFANDADAYAPQQNMPFNYQGSKPLLGFKIAAFMISGFRWVVKHHPSLSTGAD